MHVLSNSYPGKVTKGVQIFFTDAKTELTPKRTTRVDSEVERALRESV